MSYDCGLRSRIVVRAVRHLAQVLLVLVESLQHVLVLVRLGGRVDQHVLRLLFGPFGAVLALLRLLLAIRSIRRPS